VVLGEDSKYQGRRSRREVVEGIKGEGAEEESEEKWRDKGREYKSYKDKRLLSY
jgi:hypothetical protein